MDSLIDTLLLIFQQFHALDSLNSNSVTIWIRMSMSFDQFDYTFLSNSDVFNQNLHGLFTIFVNNFEIISEIVEDLAIGSIAIHRQEMNRSISAVFVKNNQLVMIPLGRNDNLIIFYVRQLCRIVLQFGHFNIVIQLL